MYSRYAEHWEVSFGDVQGRMSSLHFWPSTLTCACIKFQVLRDDVLEHQEVTPFLPVSEYEVKCNYRFSMEVPTECTHIRLAFISGDLHPISEKPKLIARSRLCLSEVRRHCPIHKYFTLYRWDPVTESNVPGGHIRIAFRCSYASDCFDGDISDCRSISSLDRLSVCSFGRSTEYSLRRSYEQEVPALPPKPVPALPRALFSSKSQQEIHASTSRFSETEMTNSSRIKTEITSNGETLGRDIVVSAQNHQLMTSDNNNLIHQTSDGLPEDKEEKDLHHQTDEAAEMKGTNRLSEDDAGILDKQPQKQGVKKLAWFGAVLGTALGLIGTIAAITIRLFSRKKSNKRRSGNELIVSEA